MNKIELNKGDKYGSLTVLSEGERKVLPSGQKNRTANCVCECGNETNVRLVHLTRGRIKSCGCLFKTAGGESKTNAYKVWNSIRTRCKSNYFDRHLYYEKGINVCLEWLDDFSAFKKWAVENGIKKGLQIDRIDNSKGYNPDNCRFVTPKVNCNNRDNTYRVEYKGKLWSLQMLIMELNNPNKYDTVRARINRGWDVEEALFKPPANNYKNRTNYENRETN